jgi:hypothetical protein
VDRRRRAMPMRTLLNWFGLRCRLRRCPWCFHETEAGCGGQCMDCGKLSGWMTSDELRAIADRMLERRR